MRWLFAAVVAVCAISKEAREIKNEFPDVWKWLSELPFHQIVTKARLWWNELPIGDIAVWGLVIVLVSFIIWALYTNPKQKLDQGFHARLEGCRPGITKRRRRRKRSGKRK